MIYDDDTSGHAHFRVGSGDRPDPIIPRVPKRHRARAAELAQLPGWGPERIEAWVRHRSGRSAFGFIRRRRGWAR